MQMIWNILVAAAVVATVSFVFSSQLPGSPRHPSKETVTNGPGNFQYYKLSLLWQPSACSVQGKVCVKKPDEEFTIHGLWPNREGDVSVSPYYIDDTCLDGRTRPYDLEKKHLKKLEKRLEKQWPALFLKDDFTFWSVEWSHHGKCSDYPQDPMSYFEAALNLHLDFSNLQEVLLKPNALGEPIKAGEMLEKVNSTYGVYPQIICNNDGAKPKLLEIRFCYQRNMPPWDRQDCPCQLSGCQYDTEIILPKK